MKSAVIYDTATGEILKIIRVSNPDDLQSNADSGQCYIEFTASQITIENVRNYKVENGEIVFKT